MLTNFFLIILCGGIECPRDSIFVKPSDVCFNVDGSVHLSASSTSDQELIEFNFAPALNTAIEDGVLVEYLKDVDEESAILVFTDDGEITTAAPTRMPVTAPPTILVTRSPTRTPSQSPTRTPSPTFEFYNVCILALRASDTDRDDLLDQEEYVQFLNRLSGDNRFQTLGFEDIDPLLQDLFATYASADAQINVFGTKPGQELARERKEIIEQICMDTFDTLDKISPAPTGQPTGQPTRATAAPAVPTAPSVPTSPPVVTNETLAPTLTLAPNIVPTEPPFATNDTLSPTLAPVMSNDTLAPSVSPVLAPGGNETFSPTIAPVTAPTIGNETVPPVASPTTGNETLSPTLSPVAQPSDQNSTQSPTQSESILEDQTTTVSGDTSIMDGEFQSDIFGTSDTLYVQKGELDVPADHNSFALLSFDMNEIEPQAFTTDAPKRATLIMHHVPVALQRDPVPLQVSRLPDTPLVIEDITGFLFSLVGAEGISGATEIVATGDEVVLWDVTDLVFGLGTRGEDNILLKIENIGDFQERDTGDSFYSREFGDGSKAATILFEYNIGETGSPTPSPVLAPTGGTSPTAPTGGNETLAPVSAPIGNVTLAPTIASVGNETVAPVASPSAPVGAPIGSGNATLEPTLAPVIAPSDGNETIAPVAAPTGGNETIAPVTPPTDTNSTVAPATSPVLDAVLSSIPSDYPSLVPSSNGPPTAPVTPVAATGDVRYLEKLDSDSSTGNLRGRKRSTP